MTKVSMHPGDNVFNIFWLIILNYTLNIYYLSITSFFDISGKYGLAILFNSSSYQISSPFNSGNFGTSTNLIYSLINKILDPSKYAAIVLEFTYLFGGI